MKLSTAKFAAILIFLMVLISPLSYVCAELQFPPHKNPVSAPVNIDPVSLMNYYSSLFQFISKSDNPSFKELIASYDLASLPASIQGLFNSFTAELNSANSNMQQIDQLLTNSSSLLDQNRLSEANQTLYEASITISGTEIILNQLGNTTLSIGDQLGVTATPANSPSLQALAGLQNSIQAVQNQLDNYMVLFQTLMIRYYTTSDNGTTATSITLQLNTSTASVGTDVAFYGQLTSNGSSLPGRNATLLLDGNIIASAVTDSNGSYSSYFSVPFDYVSQVTLFALFIPEGGDALDYISSMSGPVSLGVLYNTTNIEANIPNAGYLGLSFPIQGNVTSDIGTPLEGRAISIYIDNTKIIDLFSGSQGEFSLNYAIPANSTTGLHQLNIYVAPQGTFAGTSFNETFNIEKYPLVWNPIVLIAILGAFLFIIAFSVFMIRRNRMSRKSSSLVKLGSEGAVVAQAPSEPPMPLEIPPFDGKENALPPIKSIHNIQIGTLTPERQKVIQSYTRAWRFVERTTGVLMEPYTTINEFLQIASARLNGAKNPFSGLTVLAERSLYSQFDPASEEVSLAEAYSRSIEEAFNYGSA